MNAPGLDDDTLEKAAFEVYERFQTAPPEETRSAVAALVTGLDQAVLDDLVARLVAMASEATGLGFAVNRGDLASAKALETLSAAFPGFGERVLRMMLSRAYWYTR